MIRELLRPSQEKIRRNAMQLAEQQVQQAINSVMGSVSVIKVE